MVIMRISTVLVQRVLLFMAAGLIAVFLLHAAAGIAPPTATSPANLSLAKWLGATIAYVSHAVQGDLGEIKSMGIRGYTLQKPVVQDLMDRAPASLAVLMLSLTLALSLGTLVGCLASKFGARWLRAPAFAGTLLLLSTPDILVVMGLRTLVVWSLSTFGVKLFSLTALDGALNPSHFVAPALAVAVLPMTVVARLTSVAFDDAYDQLYIRTAMAKGASQLRVIFRHALKNAWIRVAESGPLVITGLVSGLVVVEFILYFPGVGRTLGLLLEHGGTPASASGFALVLIAWAALVDVAFTGTRLLLDPRLEEPENGERGLGRVWSVLAGLPATLAAGLLALRRLPAAVRQAVPEGAAALLTAAWAWRPTRVLRELVGNPTLLLGLGGVITLVLLALFGGHFIETGATHRVPRNLIVDGRVLFPPFAPGTPGYPLGSDVAGRDLLTRLVAGAQYTVLFTLAVTPTRFLVALPWGLAAGLTGGVWRSSSRTLGLVFSALPVLLIPAALLPLVPVLSGTDGATFWVVTVILALAGIPRLVESVRQHVEAVAVQPFIEGARAVGARTGRVLWRHIFPHLVPQLWVTAAADMAWTLMLLAQFGVFSIFLAGSITVMTGYETEGASSVTIMSRLPDWSSMLSRPYDVIFRAPWSLWIPGVCFLFAITAFNLAAEGLRRRAQSFRPTGDALASRTPSRRLVLEWGVAAVALAVVIGGAAAVGVAKPTLNFGEVANSPLEAAAVRLRALLDEANGTGPEFDRQSAAGYLKSAVSGYLYAARRAGRPIADIETDTHGRMRLLPGTDYHVISTYIEGLPSNAPGYVFVINGRTGALIDKFNTEIKVESFAVAPDAEVERFLKVNLDYVMVAGTVPSAGGRWGLGVWSGSYDEGPVRTYSDASTVLWSLRKAAPDLSLQEYRGTVHSGEIALAPSTGGTFALSKDGAVKVCTGPAPTCVTYPWEKNGWIKPKR